jgi:hypothetical protein
VNVYKPIEVVFKGYDKALRDPDTWICPPRRVIQIHDVVERCETLDEAANMIDGAMLGLFAYCSFAGIDTRSD